MVRYAHKYGRKVCFVPKPRLVLEHETPVLFIFIASDGQLKLYGKKYYITSRGVGITSVRDVRRKG